jgi:hypothetical protein
VDDDNNKDYGDGPSDLPIFKQEVQPRDLSVEETLEMAIAQSELDDLVKWEGLTI